MGAIGRALSMGQTTGETTRPTLLNRVAMQDHPAWTEFLAWYDPLLRHWCRRYGLGGEASDELCQRTWDRLWPLMRTFQYDPSRRFRGWLWRFFQSRAAEMLSEQKANPQVSLECLPDGGSFLLGREELCDRVQVGDSEDDQAGTPLALLREAGEAQAAVRSRIDPETWQAFWLTRIEDQPVRQVASSLGKSYAAVYYGSLRVAKQLRREGACRMERPTDAGLDDERPDRHD